MASQVTLATKAKETLRVFTLRKLYNVIMGSLQTGMKSSRLFYLPTRISIETGNICNLRCPLCPTGQKQEGISRGFMALEDYRKVIDELAKDLPMTGVSGLQSVPTLTS